MLASLYNFPAAVRAFLGQPRHLQARRLSSRRGRKTCHVITLLAACLFAPLALQAQWVTQAFDLKQGWNAVYVHVDASHVTLDELAGPSAPVLTPIEQVWRWTPDEAMAQFITSPQQPVNSGSQWAVWRRAQPELTTLSRLSANFAYLVYAAEAHVWQVKGKPVLPRYQWVTSGLNFLGFPAAESAPPTVEGFLAPSSLLPMFMSGTGGVFHYTGGAFSATNPRKLLSLPETPLRRGEAFWLQTGQANYYNTYYGPFEVLSSVGGALEFGDHLSSVSFRLKNNTAAALTVSLRIKASEAAPAGQREVKGLPPLLLRGAQNPADLTYGYDVLAVGTPKTWTLAPHGQPGSEVEVVVGLDRAQLSNPVGDLLAGILELTDSLGHSRVDLAVTAEASSQAGLWAGNAAVGKVGQYLKTYVTGADKRPVVQEDGSYAVSSEDTSLQPVPAAYPLRLIVHNSAEGAGGPAVLLQRVFYGLDAASNPVVATRQSRLDAAKLAEARRLSAAHLPWTEENTGWDFSGRLQRGGGVIQATVAVPFDAHESNPFLHTYHPDHDNLDARFETQVPRGSESYRVERQIRLEVLPPADDFRSRVSAGLAFTGKYAETIRLIGLARPGGAADTREFKVEGAFTLQRISEIPTLNRNP